MQTSTNELVDEGTYSSFTAGMFSKSFVEAFTVTPSNFIVGSNPATYTFIIRPRAKVHKGS